MICYARRYFMFYTSGRPYSLLCLPNTTPFRPHTSSGRLTPRNNPVSRIHPPVRPRSALTVFFLLRSLSPSCIIFIICICAVEGCDSARRAFGIVWMNLCRWYVTWSENIGKTMGFFFWEYIQGDAGQVVTIKSVDLVAVFSGDKRLGHSPPECDCTWLHCNA